MRRPSLLLILALSVTSVASAAKLDVHQAHKLKLERMLRTERVREARAPQTLAFARALPTRAAHAPMIAALAATLPPKGVYPITKTRFGWMVLTARGELKHGEPYSGRLTYYDKGPGWSNDGMNLTNRVSELTESEVAHLDNWTIVAGLQRVAKQVAARGPDAVKSRIWGVYY